MGPPHGALLESACMYSIPDKSLSSITKSTNLWKKEEKINSEHSSGYSFQDIYEQEVFIWKRKLKLKYKYV